MHEIVKSCDLLRSIHNSYWLKLNGDTFVHEKEVRVRLDVFYHYKVGVLFLYGDPGHEIVVKHLA